MPTISKKLDFFAGWGVSQYCIAMLVAGISLFSIVVITSMEILQWWEAVIIVGALALLAVGLMWTICEVKRLNN